jgi:hypothetical protein
MNVTHGYALPQLYGDGYVVLPISMSLIDNV